MDFIKSALDLEQDTIERYRSLAGRCGSHEGVRNILGMLADDHEKHLKAFTDMSSGSCSAISKTETIKAIRRTFEDIQQSGNVFSCDMDQLKLYEEARDLIKKKIRLYEDAVQNIGCEEDRGIIETIAGEEKKQLLVIENIIEMVNRPNIWLEDAEFNHLEPY